MPKLNLELCTRYRHISLSWDRARTSLTKYLSSETDVKDERFSLQRKMDSDTERDNESDFDDDAEVNTELFCIFGCCYFSCLFYSSEYFR